MGAGGSVQVANAFPADLWVRVDAEKVRVRIRKFEMTKKLYLEISGDLYQIRYSGIYGSVSTQLGQSEGKGMG